MATPIVTERERGGRERVREREREKREERRESVREDRLVDILSMGIDQTYT